MLKKHKKRTLFVFICIIGIILSSVVIWAVRSTPTVPVTYITFDSDDYDDPGSWIIKKSASWSAKNKARVTFELETVPKTNNHKKDVIFVIDTSESLNNGGRINVLKNNLKKIVDYILQDNQNRVALITFNSSSEVISNFSSNSTTLKGLIDEIEATGETNYNDALLNVDNIVDNYVFNQNRDLVAVFFTDGKPTIDTPEQIVTYELLKDKYPNLKINGIQYQMPKTIMEELEQISDEQFSADDLGLYTALLRASVEPYVYENFVINDYIDANYFELTSIDKIYTTVGTVNTTTENGLEKLVWDLGDEFLTGHKAKLVFYVNLKDAYKNVAGLYTTNDHENVTYQIQDGEEETEESDLSPVLKNYYQVTYDNNLPTGCNISSFPPENYTPYTNVTLRQDTLSCAGYNFNGWEIVGDSAQRVGNDHFIMPEANVTVRAIWSKPGISKSMDGTIHQRTTLYQKVKDDALNTNNADTYSGQSNDGGGNQTIYYYKSSSSKNFVNFANMCWKIIRTTDTGGVKLQYYSGIDEDGSCGGNNYGLRGPGTWTIGSTSYYYGTSFEYDKSTNKFKLTGDIGKYSWKTQTADVLNKYSCANSSNEAGTCTLMYYVTSYNSANVANVMTYYSSYNVSAGSVAFNSDVKSLSSVGYMYNDVYDYDTKNMNSSNTDVIYSNSFSSAYYVADSYTLTGSSYKLDNAYLMSETDYNNGDLSSIVHKYTRRSNNPDASGTAIYYIVATEGTTIYYLQISGRSDLNSSAIDVYFGDEIVDNGNNTYSLSGNISSINKLNWYSNYANATDLYTCFSNSQTCSTPYYIVSTDKTKFTYEDGTRNYVYGNDFEYDPNDDEYTLVDTTTFNGFTKNYSELGDYHYTCFNTTGKCQTLSYIFYIKDAKTPYFIYLNNNESVSDALTNMLSDANVNNYSSNIKQTIDWWYQQKLTDYESYLEDIVYCNDRTISNLGGWDPDGGVVAWTDTDVLLTFAGNDALSSNNVSLYCPNKIDRFTKNNSLGNEALTYPVGLETIQEAILQDSARTSLSARLMTPIKFASDGVYVGGASNIGLSSSLVSNSSGYLFPVVSLKSDTEYTEGNGTTASPYLIPTEDEGD